MKQKFAKHTGILALLLVCYTTAMAGDIDKAFKYLNAGDYANARKYLSEVIYEEPKNAAANYAMAKFFYLKDNKAYNLDSANIFIKLAAEVIPMPDNKETKKYLSLGVRDYTIQQLQQDINQAAYARAEKENTVESYQFFIDRYTDKGLLNRAANMRNQLAYIRARGKNSPTALKEFFTAYPQAEQVQEAKEWYEKLLYEQTTADKTFQSYKKYIDENPQGAFVKEARKNFEEKVLEHYVRQNSLTAYLEFEKKYKDHPAYPQVQDSIYKKATASGAVDAFANFVRNYTANRNLKEAWQQLYILYTAEATEVSYQSFLKEFPAFPDKALVEKDMQLAQRQLKPFQKGEKWGYVWQATKDSLVVFVPFDYEEAYEFNCGYAAVRDKPCTDEQCTYYYINKNNDIPFRAKFNFAGDFMGGYAIAGIGKCETDECKYGIIDKRGEWVVPPVYEEIEDPSEGLYMAVKNGRCGFINAKGEEVISIKYSSALPFSQGIAAVAIDGNWFFIDKEGRQIFINRFQNTSSFKDSLCAVTQDGISWGYIDMAGNYVIEPKFETAEDFEAGFAVISKKEKDPANKSLTISQRYKIDRSGKTIEKLVAPKPATKQSGRRGRK